MALGNRMTKLQKLLLVMGVLFTLASLFAPWYSAEGQDGNTEDVSGLDMISDSKFFLYRMSPELGLLYSPLLVLLLILGAATCEFFAVRYAPTFLASLGIGAVLGNGIRFARFECINCTIVHTEMGAGLFLAFFGTGIVVAATLMENRPVENVTDEPEDGTSDEGDNDGDEVSNEEYNLENDEHSEWNEP